MWPRCSLRCRVRWDIEATMTVLNTEPNFVNPDDFYEALIAMHRDLTDPQSQLVNARLILLLANHVGDLAILRAAMTLARADLDDDC